MSVGSSPQFLSTQIVGRLVLFNSSNLLRVKRSKRRIPLYGFYLLSDINPSEGSIDDDVVKEDMSIVSNFNAGPASHTSLQRFKKLGPSISQRATA